MTLTQYLEDKIEEQICKEYNVYSVDSLIPLQLETVKHRYYEKLWGLLNDE